MAKNQVHTEQDGAAAAATMAGGGIDQVRDILFGAQMSAYDRRFADLEARLNAGIDETRKQLADAVHVLEKTLESHFNDLSRQLHDEREERSRNHDSLSGLMQKEVESARDHTRETGENAARDREAIRNLLADHVRRLEEALENRFTEMRHTLDQASGDLGHRKTDRSFLASLLKETAERLERD